jgi:hypothetical protein
MNRTLLRALAVSAALLVAWGFVASPAEAVDYGARHGSSGDLFYNYYVPPSGNGDAGAQLYLCPLPTPPLVGHTYVTYPPLMPHEFLYKHHRSYLRNNPGEGWTKTKVCWF